MPSAEEFRLAAGLFDEAAQTARQGGSRPDARFGPEVMRGGRFAFSVDDVVGRSRTDTGLSGHQLQRLANEARRRAGIVEQTVREWQAYESRFGAYEAEYNQYQAGQGSAPTAPQAPPKAPAWVDLSATIRATRL